MNNPNPLSPQGSLLEEKAKGKIHLRIAIVVGIHVLILGGLLFQGCQREQPTQGASLTPTNDLSSLPPLDTNLLGSLTPLDTNPPVVTSPPPTIYPPIEPFTPAPSLTPAPVVSETAITDTKEYVVLKNDTFGSIGKKYGVSVKAVANANPGVNPTKLKIGQKLHIPPAAGNQSASADAGGMAIHVVKSGDTLTRIAKTHGTTLKEIRAANNLKTDRINVGQKLKLPARTTPQMSTEPPPGTPSLPGLEPLPNNASSPTQPR